MTAGNRSGMATTTSKKTTALPFTIPGMSNSDSATVIGILQNRLTALSDLHLTLKHVHWNVVGPNFISVHQMLDPQVDAVRLMADELAERIATLGGEPMGTPGSIVSGRTWEDYSINKADAIAHLGALDIVYAGLIEDHRKAIADTEEPDPVTQDILIEEAEQLEQFHWFIRAHLENSGGELATRGKTTEASAANAAQSKVARGR